jgi:hypothetical protein
VEEKDEDDEWWDEFAVAVYPTTKCEGYGLMARECPKKGKSKREKGGGKGGEKGKGGFGGKGGYGKGRMARHRRDGWWRRQRRQRWGRKRVERWWQRIRIPRDVL